jgi:hypothetical protein
VFEHYISSFVNKWLSLCLDSFQIIEQLLNKLVEEYTEEYFNDFENTGLLEDVKQAPFYEIPLTFEGCC